MEPDGRDVSLSERERQALLEIERELLRTDPTLAGRLPGGGRGQFPPWMTVLLLLVLGAAVMVASFTASLVVAAGGAALFAAGVGLGAVRLAASVTAWNREMAP